MKIQFSTIPISSRKFSLVFLSLFSLVGFLPLDSLWAAEEDKERWNKKYETKTYLFGREPIPFLKDHIDLLPPGAALDLAMGEGRNGVFLATKGFQVTGVDISEAGLKKLKPSLPRKK